MKKEILTLLIILICFINNNAFSADTDSAHEQQKALKDIFGFQDTFDRSPEQQWAKDVIEDIKTEMGDVSAYRGQKCQVKIHFTERAALKKIEISNHQGLCDRAYIAIRHIYQFPLPEKSKLLHPLYQTLTLTFIP